MKSLFTFLILTSASILFANEAKVSAELEYLEALIGDQVELKLSSESDTSLTPIFPNIQDSISSLEILKVGEIDSINENGVLKLSQVYTLSAFDTGRFNIPPITFAFNKSNKGVGNFITRKSNSLSIYFKGIEIDTASTEKDIKPIMEADFILAEIIEYIYLGVGLILLIIIGIYVYRKYLKKDTDDVEELFDPKIPADIIAIESLNSLKNKKLWQESHFKKYYSELTDILRIYIFRVFGIDTLEKTSAEILETINGKISEELFNELSKIFGTADLVKFAKEKPIGPENEESMDLALKFVEQTKSLINDVEDNDVQ